jgi:hypothetical protein
LQTMLSQPRKGGKHNLHCWKGGDLMVYVDDPIYPFGNMKMCHMMADTLDELHSMASKIGIQRKWFQPHPAHPHYDISKGKRQLAVQSGAQEVTSRELVMKLSLVFKKGGFLPEPVWKCFWCGGEASLSSNGDMHSLLFDKIICSVCLEKHNDLMIMFHTGFRKDGTVPVIQLRLFY